MRAVQGATKGFVVLRATRAVPGRPGGRVLDELAQDGALVMQLAEAFGGINYMTDEQREFIENWEVESYRAQQVK